MPVLRDHRVGDTLVVPGPVYLEVAFGTAASLAVGSSVIERLQIREPLILAENEARTVHTVVTNAVGATEVQIFSRDASAARWTLHDRTGVLRSQTR